MRVEPKGRGVEVQGGRGKGMGVGQRGTKGETKEGMVCQRKVGNREATNEGDGGTGNDLVDNTSPTTMGPTGETNKIGEARELVKNHK